MLQMLLMGLVGLVVVISLTILLNHFGARDQGKATARKIRPASISSLFRLSELVLPRNTQDTIWLGPVRC